MPGGPFDRSGGGAARGRSADQRQFAQRKVPLEGGESSVELLETVKPVAQIGASRRNERRELGGGVGAVAGLAPAGKPGRLLEWKIEASQVEEEADSLDVDRTVLAVRVLRPLGSRQEPVALIEAQRVGADPQLAREIADPHGRTMRRACPHVNDSKLLDLLGPTEPGDWDA